MEVSITRFMIKFDVIRKKCLPNPLVINDRLMEWDDYDKKIREFAKEQVNNSALQGIPSRKVLHKIFENLFYLQHEIKHIFVDKPTFSKYIEADENFRTMMKIKFPEAELWEKLIDLL